MPTLHLPALAGQIHHGWLPALGLARLLLPRWPDMTVGWDRTWSGLTLDGGPATADEAAEAAWDASIRPIPDGGVLPRVDADHPPAKARAGALIATPWTGPDGALWQHALLTPTGLLHPMLRMHAAQTLRGVITKTVAALPDPGRLREALTGLGMDQCYGAGLWLLRSTGRGAHASPGRDWLALMSVPWQPVTEHVDTSSTVPVALAPGWSITAADTAGPSVTWDLWDEPIPAADVPARLRQAHRGALGAQRRPHDPTAGETPMLTPIHPVHRGTATPPPAAEGVTVTVRLSEHQRHALAATIAEAAQVGQTLTEAELIQSAVDQSLLGTEMDRLLPIAQRLERHRVSRATLHADIREAKADGMHQQDIADRTGLSRGGVGKILRRSPENDGEADEAPVR